MNILIIGQNTKLASVFKNQGCNVFMVVDTTDADYRAYKENELFIILSSKTDFTKSLCIIPRSFEIRERVKEFNIDVVFTNEKNSMVAARLACFMLKTRPVLLSTSHNSYAWVNNDKWVALFAKLINYTTDGFVSLASFVYKQLLKRGIKDKKLLLCPNTLEYGLFNVKQDYEENSDVFNIVYTAVVYEGKAQGDLIEAINILKKYGYKVHVDFYGNTASDGYEYQMQLNQLIVDYKLSDEVMFKGRIENDILRQILSQYDAYVCPSHMEMSPFNILEAKASGLPIVATNVGGIPDLISDGVDGLLVSPSSPMEIANAIERLISDDSLRKQIATRALANVIETSDKAGERLMNFIKNLKK